MSRGLDIGTCFIVAATEVEGNIVYKNQRDGFFTIVAETPMNARFIEQGLRKGDAKFFKKDNKFFVIGEDALEKALERRATLQRPLHRGVINSREPESLEMIKQIISGVLGEPLEENEKCVYSVPEKPVDQKFDIVYHTNIMNQILGDLGYLGSPLNEAEAVAYAELMDEGLTGISTSWGAGMTNFSVMSSGKSELRFAIAKGGDFIDEKVALSLGLTQSLVQVEKENELDLDNPTTKIQRAICIYYDHLISSVLKEAAIKIMESPTLPKFSSPAAFVISGGTSVPKGFAERVEKEIKGSTFPVPVGVVKLAELPLETVAKGCWLASSL